MEGNPSQPLDPSSHMISESLLLERYFECFFFLFFQNDAEITFHFLKFYYPFKRKRKGKFPFAGQSVAFILSVWWIFPFLRCLYCIIFGKVLFSASPKSVMRWRMIWTCRGFVAGKISPLRGSEGVIDTKLMADLTDVRQESKREVTWALEFSAHFKHNFHINVKDRTYSNSRWPSNINKDRSYSIFICLSCMETNLRVGFKL